MPFRPCRALWPCLLAVATPQVSARAQAPTWNLLPHSAAIYERQLSQELETGANQFWGPFVREINPPLLFADELRADRRALVEPICDLRDLGRHTAFDLATWGRANKQRYHIELLNSLLPMRIEWQFHAAENGVQRAHGSLRTDAAAAAAAQDRVNYLTGDQGRMEGELELLRRFDSEHGRIQSFDFAMHLQWSPRGKERVLGKFRLEWRENWNFKALASPTPEYDASHQALLRSAIERVRTRMLQRLGPPTDRSMWPTPPHDRSTHGISKGANAALCITALLHAGVAADDAKLNAALERLRSIPAADLSIAAANLLAYAAKVTPLRERAGMRKEQVPTKRYIAAADLVPMRAWLDVLLERTRGEFARNGLIWLDPDGRFCAQRAHLATRALAEAAWCELELPRTVWKTVAEHWLAIQTDGGFLCSSTDAEPTGSTTAFALDALGLCRFFLSAANASDSELLLRIDIALREGWRWMDAHYTTRAQPGPLFYAQARRYHTSWALLSAMRNQGLRELNQRVIAWENALHYVHSLPPRDEWANPDDNALALLTLEAPPVAPTTPGSGRD